LTLTGFKTLLGLAVRRLTRKLKHTGNKVSSLRDLSRASLISITASYATLAFKTLLGLAVRRLTRKLKHTVNKVSSLRDLSRAGLISITASYATLACGHGNHALRVVTLWKLLLYIGNFSNELKSGQLQFFILPPHPTGPHYMLPISKFICFNFFFN
jgi:hypothetical protein